MLQRPYLKDLPPGTNLPPPAEALGNVYRRGRAGQPHHRHHRPASRSRGRRPGRQPLLPAVRQLPAGEKRRVQRGRDRVPEEARHGTAEGIRAEGAAAAGIQEAPQPHLARRQPELHHRPAEKRQRRPHRRPPRPPQPRGLSPSRWRNSRKRNRDLLEISYIAQPRHRPRPQGRSWPRRSSARPCSANAISSATPR